MLFKKIAIIYEDKDYLTKRKALHIFILNAFTLILSTFASILYISKGVRPGYIIIILSSIVSIFLIFTKRFNSAVNVNLIAGLFSVTAGWFFGAKDGNFIFSISTLIIVFLYLSNIRNTILVSIYCLGLLIFKGWVSGNTDKVGIIYFSDTIVMYSLFALISILTVRVIKVYSDEKDILIKEIHHRVRNNLQILSGLIEVQKTELDSELVHHFTEIQNRIFAISKVHNYVYKSGSYLKVDCKVVFHEIISNLISVFSSDIPPPRVEEKIQNINLSVEDAIPLALILNEILLNFIQTHQDSTIVVELEHLDHSYHLRIYDSSIRNQETWEIHNRIGHTLIHLFVRQLKGNLKTDISGQGTSVQLDFSRNVT
ncbi:histidine kinase [Leptospira broomii serovar Hurstbridge str. 5399]|uniref:histidine kinase n=1 Tax=Leptospira broomii serovar Hurstbridge str. 5399 TaxID=1049789 RepID=T0FER9_9LEPT|nr:sensor histidine kinase [Leptospira broomii]EQA46386.1 histidine kinase [Leptospira broomii serovar Hurstbridge str. 5399]